MPAFLLTLLAVAEDEFPVPVKAEFKAVLGAEFKAVLEADTPVLVDALGALCIAGILDAQSMAVLVKAVLVIAVQE